MPIPATPRKLFYGPVFTSLFFVVGLTGLVLYQMSKPIHIPKVYRIFLPHDRKDPPGYISFSGYHLERQLRRKKIITIRLLGDRHDAGKLEFIRQQSLQIQYANDTMQVIRVHFTAQSTYGQFLYMM
jgi:hypothetical protein